MRASQCRSAGPTPRRPGATGVDGQLVDAARVKLVEGALARHSAVTNSVTP
ncbi:hypothetical protein [Streptomyces sp. MBT53]|uniref:hypothetical protein n=1 Tax=Streptomyces sp. MBT53 TaxID=1488384 RepID=UPI001911A824|nr:hypothetical protein [Streptomyces sp. MBT53]MBK6010442.1 hypothetical protein [Streptomyces sp. MBT53]